MEATGRHFRCDECGAEVATINACRHFERCNESQSEEPMTSRTLFVSLHTDDPGVDAPAESGYARQACTTISDGVSEREAAIFEMLIGGMKQGVPDDEMTAWVEERLREMGL